MKVKDVVSVFRTYAIGVFGFSFIFMFCHLDQVSGFSLKWHLLDWVNLCNLLFIFPIACWLISILRGELVSRHVKEDSYESPVRRGFITNRTSKAQYLWTTWAPVWSVNYGPSSTSGDWIFSLFFYLVVYVLSLIVIIFILITLVLMRFLR